MSGTRHTQRAVMLPLSCCQQQPALQSGQKAHAHPHACHSPLCQVLQPVLTVAAIVPTRRVLCGCLCRDEVYALSVYDPSAQMVSMAQVLQQDLHTLDAPELAGGHQHMVAEAACKCSCGAR